MNKKLLLLFILCSVTSTIFSGYYPAKKVGDNWPDHLSDWVQIFSMRGATARYLKPDSLGRDVSEVTSNTGLKYHYYRYQGLDGQIGQTYRRVGTNKEITCPRVVKELSNQSLFILPEQAEFINKCLDTDQIYDSPIDMPILYDGTGPAPDEDPFEKKLKEVDPRIEEAYQKVVDAIEGLKKTYGMYDEDCENDEDN